MTYYNIDKLEALKLEYVTEEIANNSSNREVLNKGLIITDFIEHIRQIERDSFFDPNQLEIPFPDEDSSK